MSFKRLTRLGVVILSQLRARGAVEIDSLRGEHQEFVLRNAVDSLVDTGKAYRFRGTLRLSKAQKDLDNASVPAITRIVEVLKVKSPLSIDELVDGTGRSKSAVIAALQAARKISPKVVYIHSYCWGKNRYYGKYALGDNPDAEVPMQAPPVEYRVNIGTRLSKDALRERKAARRLEKHGPPRAKALKPVEIRSRRSALPIPESGVQTRFVGGNPWLVEHAPRIDRSGAVNHAKPPLPKSLTGTPWAGL